MLVASFEQFCIDLLSVKTVTRGIRGAERVGAASEGLAHLSFNWLRGLWMIAPMWLITGSGLVSGRHQRAFEYNLHSMMAWS